MSFRRRYSEWDEVIRRHRDEFVPCGVPEEIWGDRIRFLTFLNRGYDEWSWWEDRHSYFASQHLSLEQMVRLERVVSQHTPSYVRHVRRWIEERQQAESVVDSVADRPPANAEPDSRNSAVG
jgi:hypothetical protein